LRISCRSSLAERRERSRCNAVICPTSERSSSRRAGTGH
jgi:hypothetical protein